MNMRNIIITAALALSQTALQAQQHKAVESVVDERYGNTTIVYKDKNTTDEDLLRQLEGNFGMGDVVRITEAPPKPAPMAALPATASAMRHTARPKNTTAPAPTAVRPIQKSLSNPVVVNGQAATAAVPAKTTRATASTPAAISAGTVLPSEAPAFTMTAGTDQPELFLQSLVRPAATPAAETQSDTEQTVTTPAVTTAAKTGASTSVVKAAYTKHTATAAKSAKSSSGTNKSKGYYKRKTTPAFSMKKWWKSVKPTGRQRYKCYRF
jgi:hypothetical protein